MSLPRRTLAASRPFRPSSVRGVGGGANYQFFGANSPATCPTTPHFIAMKRKTANIDIRVEPQLIEKIDAWRARQLVPPSRSAAIVYMLQEFLEHDTPVANATWQRLLSQA